VNGAAGEGTTARREPSAGERAFFGADVEVLAPPTADSVGEALRDVAGAGRAVRPAGLGAHAGTADPGDQAESGNPAGRPVLVSTASLDDVLVYEPDDFTIGVGAGMPLAVLRKTLAGNGQEVPADLPGNGTVGGLVARGHVSPRQSRHGNLAALVLGVEGVRTTGERFRAGGMVVKNVAGYPLHKFVVGSMGRAAALTRVNLRLRQIPERRSVRVIALGSTREADELVTNLRESRLEPVLFRLDHGAAAGLPFGPTGGEVTVVRVFEGSSTRVAWQDSEATSYEIGGPEAATGDNDAAAAVLAALVALAEPPEDMTAAEGIVRLSVPPTEGTEAAESAGRVLRMTGAVPMVAADAMTGLITVRWRARNAANSDAPLEALRRVATAHRGFARLLFLPPATRSRWPQGISGGTGGELRDRLLRVFDPAGALR